MATFTASAAAAAAGTKHPVGDGGSTARFIAASTIGQAGGIANGISVFAAFGYQYTEEDTIDVIIPTGPATGAIGTLKLAATYLL
jgi:hypothetical protein